MRIFFLALVASASAYPLVASWKPSVTQLTGADRKRFLHGLCSNDINAMPVSGTKEAAVLDGRGNTKSLLMVVDDDERLLVLGAEGAGAEQHHFFDKYVFPADDVAVADCSGSFCSCYEIVGEQAGAVLTSSAVLGSEASLPAAGSAVRVSLADDVSGSAVLLGQGSLGGSSACQSFALLVEGDDEACEAGVGAALEAAAVKLGGGLASSYDALRIRRGRPQAGCEFGEGAPLKDASPLWLGLWAHVHLDKGCYLGNEVIARVARARRQKHELFGLDFGGASTKDGALEGGVLAQGAAVVFSAAAEAKDAAEEAEMVEEARLAAQEEEAVASDAAKAVGVVTSALPAEGFALALLRPPHQRAGTRVSVGGAVAEVVDLPFATRAGEQAGGGGGGPGGDGGDTEEDQSAAEAKAKAEADRKAAKLAAMQAKMKALGLA